MAKASKTNKSAESQPGMVNGMSVKVGNAIFNAETEYNWWNDLNEAAKSSAGQGSKHVSDADRIAGLNPSIL
jgi:hypothetical protein